MQNSTVPLLIINAAFYVAGFFLAKAINFYAKREIVKPKIFGVCGVFIASGYFLIRALNTVASTGHEASGSEAFLQSAAAGESVASAVIPGLLILLAVWIVGKSKNTSKVANEGDVVIEKPKKKLSDKIATVIFWMFAIILGLLVIGAIIDSNK